MDNSSNTGLDAESLKTTFLARICNSSIPEFQGSSTYFSTTYFLNATGAINLALSLESCRNVTVDSDDASQSRNVGYLYYSYAIPQGGPSGFGLIQCRSTLSTGVAIASGLNRTYRSFRQQSLLKVNTTQGFHPIPMENIDPIEVAFRGLDRGAYENTTALTIQDALLLPGLGFTFNVTDTDPDTQLTYPTSPDVLSRSMWSALVHAVAALGVLSKDDSRPFNASVPTPIAAFTRDLPWAFGSGALLILWLALIVGITKWGYRRTFSHNLNSYVAAELIFRERWLLEDVPIGDARDNHRLGAQFEALGI
ncbi:hypothetical protein V5O48_014609 [Marasmius crinis-equi]|uniref:Uncharacterized protein n=1 Tax=Marasmius crinis-equi TaxID=585013 RepID=A0ABR3EWU1_9AGAR